MLDLVILAADKNAQFALRGGLRRSEAMGTRAIEFECIVHPQRDSGVRKSGADILRLKRNGARHALLVLDYEGCGSDLSPSELEKHLDQRLATDWGDRAKAIVITPEVDIWIWGSDNALEPLLKWNLPHGIRAWLADAGFEFDQTGKPLRPKEALEAVLRQLRQPRSSALYEAVAQRISLQNCRDAAFRTLRERLVHWFPPNKPAVAERE